MNWTQIRQYATRNPLMVIIGILCLLFLWRLGASHAPHKPLQPSLPKVAVEEMTAQPLIRTLSLNGQTKEARRVVLKAKTAGRVSSLLARKGEIVKAGRDLIQIDAEDRPARLEEAKSKFLQRELEYNAGVKLESKGVKAGNELARNKAEFDAAKSLLATIEQEIADTHIKAPFDGILEERAVEVGDVIAVGASTATILDLDPLKIICSLPEKNITRLKIGEVANVLLPSLQDKRLSAKVTYIAKAADPKTRTYLVEMEAKNPDMSIPAGLTARIAFPTEEISGYRVSPAIISLRDDGVIGVKTIEEGKVVFRPVQIVEAKPEGLWVSGLSSSITLITSGGDFVVEGQEVSAVSAPLGEKSP